MDLGANEWVTVPEGHAPAARPGHPERGAARLRALDRRLRRHVLQRRQDDDVPALRLGSGARVGAAAGQRHRERDLHRRARDHGHQHRRPAQPNERTPHEHPTTASPPAELQNAAHDHLWLHFTRMGGLHGADVPIIVRGRRLLPRGLERQALPRRARRALRRADRLLVRRGDGRGGRRADARAALLHQLELRASARDRAGRRAGDARARRPEPRLLRLGRVRGDRVRLEARAAVPRPRAASGAGRRSRAASPTTGRPWARSRSTASRGCGRRSSRSSPRCTTSATRTATTVPPGETEEEFTAMLLEELEETIEQAGADTVAMVVMEPVQNAGGAFTPPAGYFQGVREICDRYGILLVRRRGHLRLRPARPLVRVRSATTSGRTSSPAPRGFRPRTRRSARCITTDAVMEPFLSGTDDVLPRDHVRRASRADGDRAQEPRDHAAREDRRARRGRGGRVPLDARAAPRPADRRRRARRRVLLRDRAREGQGDARDVHATTSARSSCAGSSPRGSSSAASSAAPTTAATP